jgi:hypothetical protein
MPPKWSESPETAGLAAPTDPRCDRERGSMTFPLVEERLIEAMGVLLRSGDRERRWLHVTSMSLWQQVTIDLTEVAVDDRPIVTCALTCAEVEQAEEAMGWVARSVPSGDTRRILGMVLTRLVTRGNERAIWPWVWRKMGGSRAGWTTEGLRKRYDRAVNAICVDLNRCGSAI